MPVKRSGAPAMTFCELVGVIEICVLPLCAIPTIGIVVRDRSETRRSKITSSWLGHLSRTFQDYPAKPPGRFPDPANSLPNPAWSVNFVHAEGCSRYASFEGGTRDGERNEKN